jgi:flagellar basal body-associated protein FliL
LAQDTQTKPPEPAKQVPAEKPAAKEKSSGSGFTAIGIMIIAAIICLGGGFFAAKKFMGPKSAAAAMVEEEPPAAKETPKKEEKKSEGGHDEGSKKESAHVPSSPDSPWLFELEPVVANLDEPGVTRYVRATLILEMSPALSDSKGSGVLDDHKAAMRNWVTIYLAGCTLDDIRGRKNLVRIQAEIKDAFNDMIFKDAKPMIKGVLFKEFQIQ